MAYTYSKIATVTVGSGGVSSIDFLAIPATYTDLVLHLSSRTTSGSFPNPYLQINGDTASNYRWRGLYGDGQSTTGSNNSTSATAYLLGATTDASLTANTFGSLQVYIPNYAGSTVKSASVEAVAENNGLYGWAYMVADLWTGTSAITSLKLTSSSGNFAQYSTAYLYGIKAEV